MTPLLIVLTVMEVALLVTVLTVYLILIRRSLRGTAEYLGNVAFGVRAIETQAVPVGRSIDAVNERLRDVADSIAVAAEGAEKVASGNGRRRSARRRS